MKASEIFDVCQGRYRSLQEWLAESTGQVRALDMESPSSGYKWRPVRARASEYMADYERIGRGALRRPQWNGKAEAFRDLLFAQRGIPARDFARGRIRRDVRLLDGGSEARGRWRAFADGFISSVALFSAWGVTRSASDHCSWKIDLGDNPIWRTLGK
jgi:hypothetical protein